MRSASNSGFTLIELLVIATIGVLITIGAINLFFSTILAGGKSTALNEVKQNGDYAITQIERVIRNAKSINPATCPGNSLELEATDGSSVVISNNSKQITIKNEAVTSGNNFLVTADISFVCHYSSGTGPPLVEFSFTLQKGEDGVSRESDIVIVPFQGRALLRQY